MIIGITIKNIAIKRRKTSIFLSLIYERQMPDRLETPTNMNRIGIDR